MRSVDGITSSKLARAILAETRDHPVLVTGALLLSIFTIIFLVWTSLSTAQLPLPATSSQSIVIPQKPVTLVRPTVGQPTLLEIPAIKLSASIETVGLTKSGAMAVPSSTSDVGWFEPGYRPGEPGNAVITGHVDTIWLRPAVFADIDQLTAGMLIDVTDGNGFKREFKVTGVNHYNVKDLPLTDIFSAAQSPHLNLITCSGKWSWKIATYLERTVVYSTLVPLQTAPQI